MHQHEAEGWVVGVQNNRASDPVSVIIGMGRNGHQR
jgi:hypothetical protein